MEAAHPFHRACQHHGFEHRLTKPNHSWTNGQVERMNRTIKGANVRCHHYDGHNQLRCQLDDFVSAYSFSGRIKILWGLTPYESICEVWTKQPERFKLILPIKCQD